jgi:lysylphosphatidylglycerol synthetase-like protein (DUF2156 family)
MWEELERLTDPRRLWLLLGGVAAMVALRAGLDATKPNAVGWASFFLFWTFALALVGLCIGRIALLLHNQRRTRRAGGPFATERSVVLGLVGASVVIRVLRGDGAGDLDTVAFVAQLVAIGLLVVIAIRRAILMILRRAAFSAWPWFWLSCFVAVAAPQIDPSGSTAFKVVAVLGVFSALAFLLIGAYRAITHKRRSK